MCEYSHAMGNSNGSLADYWDAITSTPGLQGGFIWEWNDHGLTTTLANGKRGFAYGGQFGETPHDGNFVADGLMSADLVAHPAMNEVECRAIARSRSSVGGDCPGKTELHREDSAALKDLCRISAANPDRGRDSAT